MGITLKWKWIEDIEFYKFQEFAPFWLAETTSKYVIVIEKDGLWDIIVLDKILDSKFNKKAWGGSCHIMSGCETADQAKEQAEQELKQTSKNVRDNTFNGWWHNVNVNFKGDSLKEIAYKAWQQAWAEQQTRINLLESATNA